MNSDNLQISMIFEVIGKPAEHLVETLNEIIGKIEAEKDVKLINKKVNEPAPFQAKEGFFTNFAEIELEIKDMNVLSRLVFNYMPAHVEILSPENVRLQNNDLNDFFNGLLQKLHGYDEVARIIQAEKIILENKLKQLMSDKK